MVSPEYWNHGDLFSSKVGKMARSCIGPHMQDPKFLWTATLSFCLCFAFILPLFEGFDTEPLPVLPSLAFIPHQDKVHCSQEKFLIFHSDSKIWRVCKIWNRQAARDQDQGLLVHFQSKASAYESPRLIAPKQTQMLASSNTSAVTITSDDFLFRFRHICDTQCQLTGRPACSVVLTTSPSVSSPSSPRATQP